MLPAIVPARTQVQLRSLRAKQLAAERARQGGLVPHEPDSKSAPSSPRRHKPLKWSVVPTSVVLTTDDLLYTRPPFSTKVAANTTGVTLTGLRDSSLRDSQPMLASLGQSPRRLGVHPPLSSRQAEAPERGQRTRSNPPSGWESLDAD